MNISCSIIRDLLPLYAEDLTSEDSRKLVDDHLCGCDECTRQLGILKKAAELPIEVDTKAMKRVEETIRRKRILTVVTALLMVLTVIVTSLIYMFTPVFLTADQAIEGVELREDGGLAIDYASGITGRAGYALNQESTQWGIMCYTTRYDWLKTKLQDQEWKNLAPEELEAYILDRYEAEEMTQRLWDRFHNISVEYGTWTLLDGSYLHIYDPEVWIDGNGEWTDRMSDRTHWYLDICTGEVETHLWGTGAQEEETWIEPFYGYAVLFFGMIGLAIVLTVISRKTNGWKQVLYAKCSILCGSIAFSTLLVTGGTLVIGDAFAHEWNKYIGTESVFVVLMLHFWQKLHWMNRKEKGM